MGSLAEKTMIISNDKELKAACEKAGILIQAIQDYAEREYRTDAKIRFPRGWIRKAPELRKRFWFFEGDALKRNLSYQLIFSDVLMWLLNRTDIFGSAKEMVIKEGICLFASQCETMLKVYCGQNVAKKKGYAGRVEWLHEQQIIDNRGKDELLWLWDARAASHVFLVEHREHEKYAITDYNRARKAYRVLGSSIETAELKARACAEGVQSADPV